MPERDILIIGGGVIGLSIAYVLAREGVRATVLDRGALGREASWAGAGMIPPHTERLTIHPTVDLRSWSAVLYPEWSAALREETGIDNGYRRTGGVDVAFAAEEEQDLRSMAGRWKIEGIVYERLAPSDFARVEPALSHDLRVAYFLPDRAQVRNPRHLRALATASVKRGATLRRGVAVEGFEILDHRITGVRTSEGLIACGQVVVSAGAWTGALLGTIGITAPTPPLRGQIVLLKGDRPILKRIVEHGSSYLVPREDGHILIGSTEEDVGFDTSTTILGVRGLIDEAVRLCPALAATRVEKTWAGLRPGSIDSRPYIGPLPGFTNAFVAAGHKRAGIQLSPGTAEVMTDLVLGRPTQIDMSLFHIDRAPAVTGDQVFRS